MVLVGTGTADDAGVYRISDELALIQTVDFFTPIVDDPYDFGRIAAANALSDIYAMGGVPKTAMNVVCFPIQKLGKEVLAAILAGGAAKVKEAGAVLLGGHSVEDEELKYGLSVTGFVHPERILTNQGLRPGDCLLLTKPLGTGIINTAIKGGLASRATIASITEQMAELNSRAATVMARFPVSACTDVTGFGLLGHLAEMISNTTSAVTLQVADIPILQEAQEFASMGFVPVGAHRNREFREHQVTLPEGFSPVMRDILFDPQTSGGLLIGCPEKEAGSLLSQLHEAGITAAAIIGTVQYSKKGSITII